MTREQMISTLRGMDFGSTIGSKGDEALRMAIAELEQEPTDENLHREREQAYMQGYEDASKRFRPEPCTDAVRVCEIYADVNDCENGAQELCGQCIHYKEPCDDIVSREFVELVVEYPPADLCAYSEYKGKPYYSIKYYENGEEFIGYGTYKPEVLSRYLKEYFISSVTQKSGKWIEDAKTYYEELNKRGLGVDEYTPYFTDDIACSECLAKYNTIDNETEFFKYCPNCGAKMVEPQESEE